MPNTPIISAPTDLADHLKVIAGLLDIAANAPDFHWAATSEGAIVVDPFPNPDRYAIASLGPVKLAIDCGTKGISVRPPEAS